MSVARCLGVDDRDGPNMKEVRSQWPQWCEDEPALEIVDDLLDLPHWMRQAEPGERDAVVSALLRLGTVDRRASMVLAWLLVPGASLLAGRLRNLVDVIDEVVAGQLWIQICDHDPSDDKYVAKKILGRVERRRRLSLGSATLPSAATRRGLPRLWSRSLMSRSRPMSPAKSSKTRGSNSGPSFEALDDGDLSEARRDLLLDLAHAANLLNAPLRRGRAGLTAPSVAQMVSEDHALSARTVRRQAADDIDVLASVARRPGLGVEQSGVAISVTPLCNGKVVQDGYCHARSCGHHCDRGSGSRRSDQAQASWDDRTGIPSRSQARRPHGRCVFGCGCPSAELDAPN